MLLRLCVAQGAGVSALATCASKIVGKPYRIDHLVDNISTGKGTVSIGVHDPFDHIGHSAGNSVYRGKRAFELIRLDNGMQEKLLFLHLMLRTPRADGSPRDETALITVAGYDTGIDYVPRMFVDGAPVDIYLDYQHPDTTIHPNDPDEPEAPILSLVGGVAEFVVKELRTFYSGRYWETVKGLVETARADGYGHWGLGELYREADILLGERMPWVAKYHFYDIVAHKLPPEMKLQFWEDVRLSADPMGTIQRAFRKFYRLNEGLSDRAWYLHIPDIDIAFANPIAKVFGKKN